MSRAIAIDRNHFRTHWPTSQYALLPLVRYHLVPPNRHSSHNNPHCMPSPHIPSSMHPHAHLSYILTSNPHCYTSPSSSATTLVRSYTLNYGTISLSCIRSEPLSSPVVTVPLIPLFAFTSFLHTAIFVFSNPSTLLHVQSRLLCASVDVVFS